MTGSATGAATRVTQRFAIPLLPRLTVHRPATRYRNAARAVHANRTHHAHLVAVLVLLTALLPLLANPLLLPAHQRVRPLPRHHPRRASVPNMRTSRSPWRRIAGKPTQQPASSPTAPVSRSLSPPTPSSLLPLLAPRLTWESTWRMPHRLAHPCGSPSSVLTRRPRSRVAIPSLAWSTTSSATIPRSGRRTSRQWGRCATWTAPVRANHDESQLLRERAVH